MEPISKGLKLSGQMDTRIHHVDRISNLPPDLIGYILSFLPTKEAVATSVLSTKWKWFWTFITRLDFNDKCSSLDEDDEYQTVLLKASFISFVYRVVFYRKPTPLNYFGVTCLQEYCASHLRAWLSAVLPVGIKELDLSIHLRKVDKHLLPSEMFSCKSLKKLKLKLCWGFKIDVPTVVCLPSLEGLTLNGVEFRDDDSLKRLLVGCPAIKEFESDYCRHTPGVLPLELFSFRKLAKLILGSGFVMNPPTHVCLPNLENLYLRDVKFPNNDALKRFLLGCPSLRELILTTYDADTTVLYIDVPMLSDLTISLGSNGVLHSKVVLDTPSIRSLKVNGLAAERFEVANLSQLVAADIRRIYPAMQVASDLISAVSKVQTLYLSGYILEVIVKRGCKLPKFHNMTTLKLGVGNKAGWALLPDLVENAPILETLVLLDELKGPFYSTDPTSTWHAPQKVRLSLSRRFKLIEEVFKYLNENRGVLKDLTIQYPCGWEAVGKSMSVEV